MTSGSKGIHLYAALPGKLEPGGTTALAKEIAEELQREHRALVTADHDQGQRSGRSSSTGRERRLQDHPSRRTPCAAGSGPRSPTPLAWGEVEAGPEDPLDLEQFSFEAVLGGWTTSGTCSNRADGGRKAQGRARR